MMVLKAATAMLACLLLAGACRPAQAGAVLDDILNTMVIDQSLQRSGDDLKMITNDKPLGQSFVTGDSVVRICRIAVRVHSWNEEWQPDETLVMTLWESPKRQTSLGRFAIPYARRQWHGGILMFYVESDVQPKHDYYFELTVEGGNGKIQGLLLAKHDVDYPGGCAYEAGAPQTYDIWFETHVKKIADRDANFAEFFGNFNLDYPGMEKVKAAVASADWDAACREFLTYIEGRRDLFNEGDAAPTPDPKWDTREADLVVDQKWPASDGSIVDLGPNWNYFATWPALGGVGLTRTGLQKPLAFAYWKTGNEKYARAWNDMLISMFRNVPCPLKSGVITGDGPIGATIPDGISGALWDSISLAARLHHETFYNRFRKTPLFEPDVRMAWWANLVDMVNTLSRMKAGGNWTTQNTSSLFGFARKYPELKRSKEWFAQGFEGLKANFKDNMYPDGPCKEATTGYHSFSLGMFFGTYKEAVEMDLDVPQSDLKHLETCFEYTMYSTQPDWQLPVWGDTNRPNDPTGLIAQGGDYFRRDDMKWVGSKGKVGTKPARTSIDFPIAGYFVMRSGWDPQARFLVTRNGFTQSHYHNDQLSVIVNAYGVDLLPDAGIYNYGTPECNELVKTKSHSTISVDGKNILPGNGESEWLTLSRFDYYCGTSPGYHDLKDVKHSRSILFLKPDYWVISDRVNGPGEHTASQYWRFAPGQVSLDTGTGVARTQNSKGGNLAVIPLGSAGLKREKIKDVYALGWDKVTHDAPVARYERSGALPISFCTVLFPYPAGSKGELRVRELTCTDTTSKPSVSGACVNRGQRADYVALNSARQRAQFDLGGFDVTAEAGFVRRLAKPAKVTAFGWYDGTSIGFGGKTLASSAEPLRGLSVAYEKDSVVVQTDGAAKGLRVAAQGAKQAIVNGKPVKLAKGAAYFAPLPD